MIKKGKLSASPSLFGKGSKKSKPVDAKPVDKKKGFNPAKIKDLKKNKSKKVKITTHVPDPEVLKVINQNVKDYNKNHVKPYIGFVGLDDDILDGHNSLRTRSRKNDTAKDIAYNLYQLINYCHRASFLDAQKIPSQRPLVSFYFDDIFMSETIPLDMLDDPAVQQGLYNLGRQRFSVRLLPIFKKRQDENSLYILNDIMQRYASFKYVSGFLTSRGPREIVISRLRKLEQPLEMELSTYAQVKQRVIVPYEYLKQGYSKISEIKSSEAYRKLCAAWSLQTPIIQVKSSTSQDRLRKISNLGDLLITE